MFLPQCEGPSFTPIQNNTRYSSSVYLILFDSKLEDKEFCKSFPKCSNYLIETQLNLYPIHLITGSYTDLTSPRITSDCHQCHNW